MLEEYIRFWTGKKDVRVSTDKVEDYLISIAPNINREPVNARFTFLNNRAEIFLPHSPGRRLNIDKSAAAIVDGLIENKNPISLIVDEIEPEITLEKINSLGIDTLLATGTSDFAGSSAGRLLNIKIASAKYNGLILKPGEEFSISITEDKEAITLKVKDIVDKINAVLTFIKEQNSMDDKTDTTRTLGGESLLQTLESRIRSALFKTVNTKSGPRRVGDIGITFQRTGLLQFDSKAFESAVAKDFQTVADVLTGTVDGNGIKYEGFIGTIFQTANLSLRTPDGVISSRKRTFGDRIEDIDRRIEDKERMLSQKEKSLKDKFSRLESTMSQIRNQGAGIASLGQEVPPVQQLG